MFLRIINFHIRQNVRRFHFLNYKGSQNILQIAFRNTPLICKIEYASVCDGNKSGSKGGDGGSGKFQITYKPYVRPTPEDHDYKNMRLKRPMSPHLTIYAPTLPAMTSIGQRATGCILTFYVLMLSGGTLFLSNGVDTYISVIQSLDLSRPFIMIIKILLGFPFAFHYAIGVRFCVWNLGKWLTLPEIYSSANYAFILSAIITVFFALR